MLHLGENFIIPAQTPSLLRLLFKSVPFLGIIIGISFLFGEPDEKNKSLGKQQKESDTDS